jgi:hypothetical protein
MGGYAGLGSVPINQPENADNRDMLNVIKNKAWEKISSMEKNQAMDIIYEFLDEHHPLLTRNVFGDFRVKNCHDAVVNQ